MVASWSLLAAAGRAGEHFLKTRLRLPLPAADLVRMYFVLARDRLDRAVPAQRFGRYLGFELRCESASFRRHPLGPPHGLVYTLTSCPFFRDHLMMRFQRFRYLWIWQAGLVAMSGRNTVVLKLPAGEYFQRFGVAMARLATL